MSGLPGSLLHFYKDKYIHSQACIALWWSLETMIVTLIEIGPVYNDVSCKSIAGPFLLRYNTIKSRK